MDADGSCVNAVAAAMELPVCGPGIGQLSMHTISCIFANSHQSMIQLKINCEMLVLVFYVDYLTSQLDDLIARIVCSYDNVYVSCDEHVCIYVLASVQEIIKCRNPPSIFLYLRLFQYPTLLLLAR
jgi:hypothetical protein